MAGISAASCAAEFVGTFILIFTVGCNVLAPQPVWGGVSIACSLMVSIYALGSASGANFNPAVSFALGLAGKMEDGFKQVAVYWLVQLTAGICAFFSYSALYGASPSLGPAAGFVWWQAMLCELLYTWMLCFTVLNVAASKQIGGQNQFYGLAIGFVIVAGAYGAGAVSGGCFNPAVALAIGASGGLKWAAVYAAFELLGAALAVGMFWAVRPEERTPADKKDGAYSMTSKLIAEALGTYMLVVTVGLNVLNNSKAGAFSIAASLMVMIMAVGDISGGQFNPAVTVAILGSGRKKIDSTSAGLFICVQLVAGLLGALTYASVMDDTTFPLGPKGDFGIPGVAGAEVVYTFVLTFVVLCTATMATPPAKEYTGFIIGMCVTVGGFAIGDISGGSLNPAVSFGIAISRAILGGAGAAVNSAIYMALELAAGLLAAGIFKVVYPKECAAKECAVSPSGYVQLP